MPLEKVYKMPELASMIGWSRARLVKRLLILNTETGGALLRNIGKPGCRPCWTTTLSALRATAPQWFRDDAALENRLEDVEDKVEQSGQLLNAMSNQVMALAKRVREQKARGDMLEQNLRAVLPRLAAAG